MYIAAMDAKKNFTQKMPPCEINGGGRVRAEGGAFTPFPRVI